MNETPELLRLTIGPLHYEFRAHDAWGVDALERLRANVVVQDFAGAADRVLHLADLGMTPDENGQINQDWLPDRYAGLLPPGAPRQGWRLTGDETGHLSFLHEQTHHNLFIFGVFPADHRGPFQLPWAALLDDIVGRGGGAILHGGLITQGGRGYIITAPPGGGKTTSIRRLPEEWQVLADDACLVWPVSGKFVASPLPTWSVLLGRGEALPSIGRWQVGARVPVGGILLLHKAEHHRLSTLSARDALLPLYQALCEHPRVVTNRDDYPTHLFDCARYLAWATPVWRLDVTLAGRFWEMLCGPLSQAHS